MVKIRLPTPRAMSAPGACRCPQASASRPMHRVTHRTCRRGCTPGPLCDGRLSSADVARSALETRHHRASSRQHLEQELGHVLQDLPPRQASTSGAAGSELGGKTATCSAESSFSSAADCARVCEDALAGRDEGPCLVIDIVPEAAHCPHVHLEASVDKRVCRLRRRGWGHHVVFRAAASHWAHCRRGVP